MTILDKIEHQWICYVAETGRSPQYIFLGYQDLEELDKALGKIVFRYKDVDVVMVQKERHISVGNKYMEG